MSAWAESVGKWGGGRRWGKGWESQSARKWGAEGSSLRVRTGSNKVPLLAGRTTEDGGGEAEHGERGGVATCGQEKARAVGGGEELLMREGKTVMVYKKVGRRTSLVVSPLSAKSATRRRQKRKHYRARHTTCISSPPPAERK
jgi:hypothetical protein